MGTISSLNEYITFRQEHGIDNHSYKDLYIGDYFKIQDGTYNQEWMVAHFDYYYNKGVSSVGQRGVVLIPRYVIIQSKMKDSNDTSGGYTSSIPYTTVCPAIANALSTVLGSYLLTINALLSNTVNNSVPSMCGAGVNGASTDWNWYDVRCIIPSETQVFGPTVLSSSFYDVGEAYNKLALFNFINTTYTGRAHFWLRNVSSSSDYAYARGYGDIAKYEASSSQSVWVKPLIYIG